MRGTSCVVSATTLYQYCPRHGRPRALAAPCSGRPMARLPTRIMISLAPICLVLPSAKAGAQQRDTARAMARDRSGAPVLLTVRSAGGPIRLDGRLDDVDWAGADSLIDFRQREPDEGAPVSERTIAKVLRDDDALYVGVRAWDRRMPALRAAQLRVTPIST